MHHQNEYKSKVVRSFTRRLVPLFIMVVVLSCRNQAPTPDYSAIFKKWDDSIPEIMRSQAVSGLSVAVVNESGVLWMKGYGYNDTLKSRLVDEHTLFSAQSVSKNLTAAAVLKATHEGLVDLDAPITRYIPWFTVNSRFEAKPESKMTLRLLLSHRAGFTHEAPVGNNFDNSGSFEEHIKSISSTWLRFRVGERYSYSNLGVDLAGYVIQVLTGKPFADYVEEKVLKPTRMVLSSFDQEKVLLNGNRAIGYLRPGQQAPFHLPIIPSGGLYTSAEELGRYVVMHLNEGKSGRKRVVEKDDLEEMYAIPDPFPDQINGYGLGISVRSEYGLLLYGHGGNGFGFCSNMMWSPEYKLGIVMLTNSSAISFQNTLPTGILFELIEAESGKPLAEQYPRLDYSDAEVAIDSLTAKDMSGNYLYNGGSIMILEYCEGRIGIGQSERFDPAIFTSPTEFNFGEKGYPSKYTIVESSIGSAYRLIRHYDGENLDLNEGRFETSQLPEAGWDSLTGNYKFEKFGRVSASFVPVTIKNGSLYVYHMKLKEHEPGLFFTAHGEALDFRAKVPLWKNIALIRER